MLSIPMLSNVILFVAAECLKLLDKERCSVLYLFDNYFLLSSYYSLLLLLLLLLQRFFGP